MVTGKDSTDSLRIAFGGDVMLGAGVGEHLGEARVGDWLKGISDVWHGADLLIANLECPCVLTATPVEGPLPEIVFHAPHKRLSELADAGFSAVTLANNHILDCGPQGLLETVRGLDKAGIYHAGAGMELAEALQPAFIPIQKMTLGLVAFCYGPPAGRSTPGVAPYDFNSMRKALSVARADADFVVAVLHDGLEYSDVPPTQTRKRFRFLAENGADIVIGHHPHVLQGLEWHKGVPIAYGLGDLLFDNSLPSVATRNFMRIAMGRYAPAEIRRDPSKFERGAVLLVRITGKERSVEWHPFRQDTKLRPKLSSGDVKFEDLRRLDEISAALLNPTDPRHRLADSVVEAAQKEQLTNLGIRDVLKLAARPRLRYVSRGLRWLYQRFQAWHTNGTTR